MSDIEYSVITSDVLKSFDCIYMLNNISVNGTKASLEILFLAESSP